MAKAEAGKKIPGKERKDGPKKGLSDTQRWVSGVVLFAFSMFALVAVVSYYFYWSADQNFVKWGDIRDPGTGVVSNPTGKLGAVLAHNLVGEWFGVFGLVVPVVLIIIALRTIDYRPAVLTKSVRIALVALILGSLSLGYLFGRRWGVFGTGLGGNHGIYMSDWIRSYLGTAGTGLLLLLGWILLGVYISRRTITVVNNVGRGIYDGGVRVGGAVTDLVARGERDDPDDLEERYDGDEEIPPPPFGGDAAPERFEIERGGGREAPTAGLDGFGVSDNRGVVEGARGGMTVWSAAPEPEPEPEPEVAEEESNVVYLGGGGAPKRESAAAAGRVAAETVAAAPVGGMRVVEIDRGEKEETRRAEPLSTATPLSAGGVMESADPGGVKAVGGMQVIAAGHSDAVAGDDRIDERLFDPTREIPHYRKPPVELLEDHSVDVQVTEEEIYEHKNQIVRTLENFGIRIDRIKATVGPTVTLYEIVPAAGVKISKIKNLEDDIALSLKALGIRIIAPMPGKGTVGIEVPNKDKEIVSMYSVVRTMKFQESRYELPVVLGKTISNETFMIDLAKMPHLLVAGATGQGKSVGLNAIITSLIYRKHPAELKFVLVDPKRVELSLYGKLERHFLAKMESEEEAILTDTQRVIYTLNALCQEMTDRYDLLRMAEVKKIGEYNEKFLKRRLNPKKGHRFMPYIVVVIDEFADMIMTAGREIEAPITRLAQLARAVGIHLVIATQRPDVKVITGLIKANFPARIAFRVMSMVDSRTIIDQPGANQLIGRGDMLMSMNGELTRVQCAFIDTPEIERITEFVGNQKGFPDGAYRLPDYSPPDAEGGGGPRVDGPADPMLAEVARFVVQNQQGSTSSVQRRFAIGYNRAGRIMDQLEDAGVVGRAEGSKPREVLILDLNSLEYVLGKFDE